MNYNLSKHLNLAAVIINSFAAGINAMLGQYTFVFIQALLIGLCLNMALRSAEKEAIMKHEEKKL